MKQFLKKLTSPLNIILIFTGLRLVLHLLTNAFAGYGYFRDELYYIACSNRLDFGYVDHPPLSIFILSINRLIFGDSIFALRLLPAVCAAAVVYITGLITLKLNGGVPALIIALTCVVLAPVSLGMHSIFSMNAFDWLLWSLAFLTIINLFSSGNKNYWYLLGVILGLGLLNKTGFLWLGTGLFAALLITKERRTLLTIYPYIAALIAFLLFLPYILWNFSNDFAHLEFISNAVKYKYEGLSPLDFIMDQFIQQNPLTFIVWLLGIIYLLENKSSSFRIPGIIFLTVYFILLINGNSKAEYIAPAYPLLFAAGGAAIEKLEFARLFSRFKYAYTILIAITGVVFIPAVLPVLPVEDYISYSRALGMVPTSSEGTKLEDLPQHFADMFGWETLAEEVSKVYTGLSEDDKPNAFVYAQNYGEAAAIEFFSSKYELPQVVCPHNSYWLWEKEKLNNFNYHIVIILGGKEEDHYGYMMRVEEVKRLETKYAIPYEGNLPIFIARGFKVDVRELWEKVKIYI